MLGNITSVMDIGIMLGALVASAAAGVVDAAPADPRAARARRGDRRLLMGYGARIAYGCNIGAYFAGIASFSLHGWIWGALALLGTCPASSCARCSAWATRGRPTPCADRGLLVLPQVP